MLILIKLKGVHKYFFTKNKKTRKKKQTNTDLSHNLIAISKGLFFFVIMLLMLSALAGIIYYFSDLPENTILFISYSILFFSTFLSAVFTTGKIKSKGLYYGIIIGVSCFGSICIISNITYIKVNNLCMFKF